LFVYIQRDFLAKLLAKRGKLMELKNKITSKGKKEITEEETAGMFKAIVIKYIST
jgi:hypothetical protein